MLASLKLLAVLPLLLVSLACTSLDVSGTVRSVAAQDLTADGFTLAVDVDVHNPNPGPLPISAAEYRLTLAGEELFVGTARPDTSIPARDRAAVQIPLHIDFQRLLQIERSLARGRGIVVYHLSMDLHFGNPFLPGRSVRLPLDHNGTINLRQLLQDPQALLGSPAAQQLARSVLGAR